MPRTKVSKKISAKEKQKKELLEKTKKEIINDLQEQKQNAINSFKLACREELTEIHSKYRKKTIDEILNLQQESVSTVASITRADITNISKIETNTRRGVKRSMSCGDDGYRSISVDRTTSTARQSRCRSKQAKTSTMRSVSQNKVIKGPNFCTPANSNPPKNFDGTVTPKFKLNTPQVLLRRPKEGEVALSMQGSPLYTAVLTDKKANINIPMKDGTLLTLQPQKGLRLSQLPDFDSDTLNQLAALRENLSKIFSAHPTK